MYKGIVTSISVIKSGGVMIAATNIIRIKACLRYLANKAESTNPSFVKAKTMTGSWKTTPMSNVSVVNGLHRNQV